MVKFNLVEMPMNRRDEQYIPPLRYHWLTPFYDPIVRLTTQEFLQAVRRAVTPGGES